MSHTLIAPNVWMVSLGFVNAFLIVNDELTLIDTGVAGSAPAILQAIRAAGKQPSDLKHILLTHLHTDHVGGVSDLQAATGARIYMHPEDAAAFEQGLNLRPVQPAPGLLNRLITTFMPRANRATPKASARVDVLLKDGDSLPFAGGLRVIHAPGHTAGHTVFLRPQDGGILFLGDACSNFTRLAYSFIYEDFEQGRQTLRKLSALDFQTAAFSHGKVLRDAAGTFRQKWERP